MTAPDLSKYREQLAEAQWRHFGFPSEGEREELPNEEREDWRKDADALLASPVLAQMKREWQAEALWEAAEGCKSRAFATEFLPGVWTDHLHRCAHLDAGHDDEHRCDCGAAWEESDADTVSAEASGREGE